MTVTVEARHGKGVPPVVNREDVVVDEGHDHDRASAWIPAQGDHAGLELLILVDDSSGFSLGSQLNDIRAFISHQPPTTFVGVGYMANGTVNMVAPFTQDHARAAQSLRLPHGAAGGEASPYFSVSDYVKNWSPNPSRPRREILMISDGVDHYYGGGPQDPYVQSAVEDAQRAGILIFTIYTPGSGHDAHSFFRTNWGQNDLSQLSDQTGGESYYTGVGAPVSFTPYLAELTQTLQHQYLLTFTPKPQKKAGLQRVRLNTEVQNAELVSADQVYVPATLD